MSTSNTADVRLPRFGTLTQRQQRGQDCVWCGVTLVAGHVVDLGPRRYRRADWLTQWFPVPAGSTPQGTRDDLRPRTGVPVRGPRGLPDGRGGRRGHRHRPGPPLRLPLSREREAEEER